MLLGDAMSWRAADPRGDVCHVHADRTAAEQVQRATSRGRSPAIAVSCDQSSLSSVRACARTLLEQCPRIDVQINCAGVNSWERRVSAEGHEMNWAINYLGLWSLSQEAVHA